ncbi:DUF4282 domain-containing protein [Actinocorallia sp. A-T 12471]|uniref:DUF4282 domain-containing protein n=1 Tax=Actinocorallia sp. A-T 12471 TaxID=3089813 RepID=UPI0029D26E7A|nr:DUF4282 domain-containing protein [Actinocorallia sp. A-T 12471]MDX6738639.1 DUF4282 domain-containing protein [Actinocorallia sp. A-T 12471]
MTTPPEQPRFNPNQYGYRPDQPPASAPPQRPVPSQWQGQPPQGDPQQSGQHPTGPRPVRRKGFFGALLDTRFDAMVTPMLIRGFYLLSLAVITLFSILLFLFIWGLGGSNPYEDAPAWPFITAIIVTPIFWIFQVVCVRLALEFVINQFKITEELQKIRRNTGPQG